MIQHTRVFLPWKYLRHHLHKYQEKDINCRTLILFSSHFLSLHGGNFPLYFPLSLPHSHPSAIPIPPSFPYLTHSHYPSLTPIPSSPLTTFATFLCRALEELLFSSSTRRLGAAKPKWKQRGPSQVSASRSWRQFQFESWRETESLFQWGTLRREETKVYPL